MFAHRIQFEAPMGATSRVRLAGGSIVPVSDLASMSDEEIERRVPDDLARDQLWRFARQQLVLPGADRWRVQVAIAKPADPMWVGALERNARVVEIEMARDALASPWHPTATTGSGADRISILGAMSGAWVSGPLEFDVWVTDGGIPQAVRYRLSESDRRYLWDHLTGHLLRMKISRGDVRLGGRLRLPTATVGMVGIAVDACYAVEGADMASAYVREDGDLRRDQLDRTELAEQHAALIRRWQSAPTTPVDRLPLSVSEMRSIGRNDLAESSSRARARWLMIGTGGLALAAGAYTAVNSKSVRGWIGRTFGESNEPGTIE